MGLPDAIVLGAGIIGAAIYFGLGRVEDALDNVAIGIEQFSLNIVSLFDEEDAE